MGNEKQVQLEPHGLISWDHRGEVDLRPPGKDRPSDGLISPNTKCTQKIVSLVGFLLGESLFTISRYSKNYSWIC